MCLPEAPVSLVGRGDTSALCFNLGEVPHLGLVSFDFKSDGSRNGVVATKDTLFRAYVADGSSQEFYTKMTLGILTLFNVSLGIVHVDCYPKFLCR